jgi:peptide/nickel transport system permease protein
MHNTRIIAAILVLGIAACVIIGPRYLEATRGELLISPNAEYWLGTDSLGRSVLARSLDGMTASFGNAIVVLLGAIVIGSLMAIISILQLDKKVDQAIILLVEAIRAFPTIVLVLSVICCCRNIKYNSSYFIFLDFRLATFKKSFGGSATSTLFT